MNDNSINLLVNSPANPLASQLLELKNFAEDLKANAESYASLFHLRQRYQMNVNIVLFILWFALAEQARLTKKELILLQAAVVHWHERVVLPLRQLEMSLASKKDQSEIKEWVAIEIDLAEQMEKQFLIEALTFRDSKRSLQQQLADACHNFILYCKFLKIQQDSELRESSLQLFRVVFPNLSDASIEKACDTALQQLSNSSNTGSQLAFNGV